MHASKKALEQNIFHVRVKWLTSQQKLEISRLQELVAGQKKELKELWLLYNSSQYVLICIQNRHLDNLITGRRSNYSQKNTMK
jgi:hypothetical protein